MMWKVLSLVVAGAVVGGCGILGLGGERVIGAIDDVRPGFFVVPDSAAAGQAFTVTVITFGDGCYQPGDTEVTVDGNVAVIVPYDIRESGSCILLLVPFEHQASIQFDTAGDAQVILRAVNGRGFRVEFTEVVRVY